MEILLDPEELIICPYNNSHHIRRNRMGFHLVKCKKNYPDARIETCDFNVTHQIPAPEIQYHHEHCCSKKDIEISIYREHVLPHRRSAFIKPIGNEEINKFPIHNIPVQTTESWDDCNSASYDPKGYCERNEVLRKLDVEPASKRKNFYVTERNRIKRFTEENIKGIIENETIDKENEVKKSEEEKVIPKTSVNNTINECTPDSITNLLKQVKLGANKSFNSIQNN